MRGGERYFPLLVQKTMEKFDLHTYKDISRCEIVFFILNALGEDISVVRQKIMFRRSGQNDEKMIYFLRWNGEDYNERGEKGMKRILKYFTQRYLRDPSQSHTIELLNQEIIDPSSHAFNRVLPEKREAILRFALDLQAQSERQDLLLSTGNTPLFNQKSMRRL